MKLGIAYYPEHETAAQWPIDYKKLQDAGIKRIRIAEFAWAVMEPNEGEYHWEWLDQSIALAAEYGLEVVLCTPTACPPIWLVEQYPEVLPVNKLGKNIGFGARQHRSYSSAKYVEYSMKIVTKLAERYGEHPNVVAWQLDNEFGGETKYDFGECSKQAFHAFLAEKYRTIEQLNQRWGTVFWSQHYQRFNQIPLPAPLNADVMMWHHPSLELEFARFSSHVLVKFAQQQTEILRKYIGNRPITTNAFMFAYGDNIDWTKMFAGLDVLGMDIYSDKPHEIAFYSDACRSLLNKPFWMLEYGAGTSHLKRDMQIVRDRGCSHFFLFKTKPFPWGQEQARGGMELLTLTGEPSPNYGVIQKYAEKYENEPELSEVKPARIGMYYHFDSSWVYQTSVSDRIHYPDYLVHTIYKCIFETAQSVDIIYTPEQIKAHDLLIIPLHVLYNEQLEDRLIEYVKAGGKLVATTDLFRKNEDNVYLTAVPKLFPELFDWQENNFVTDSLLDRKSIYLTHPSGKGRAWLVARDNTLEEWQSLLEIIGED